MSERVVVTGIGAITPLGATADETWRATLDGQNGIGPITSFDTTGFSCRIAGEVKGWDPNALLGRRLARRTDRFAQFAIVAARDAVADAGLEITDDNRDGIGCFIGSGIGGLLVLEQQVHTLRDRGPSRISPFMIPEIIANMAAGLVAIDLGIGGPNIAIVTACATGAHSIGEAAATIKRGAADVMLAGGTEAAIGPIGLAGFCAGRALSTRNDDYEHASRPFDKDRDGFVAAEGAGVFVLESYEHANARGAPIHAEILGYGLSSDAFHITQPPAAGDGAARSMQTALDDARLDPSAVDYINAHGTSTPAGDLAETNAVKQVFNGNGATVPVSSTKSMMGHLIGAAGSVEAMLCIKAIHDGVIPPTINYETPDPECDLDYVTDGARDAPVRCAMSNSFGFGGHNATLIVGAV